MKQAVALGTSGSVREVRALLVGVVRMLLLPQDGSQVRSSLLDQPARQLHSIVDLKGDCTSNGKIEMKKENIIMLPPSLFSSSSVSVPAPPQHSRLVPRLHSLRLLPPPSISGRPSRAVAARATTRVPQQAWSQLRPGTGLLLPPWPRPRG